jgi:hypothetical protein
VKSSISVFKTTKEWKQKDFLMEIKYLNKACPIHSSEVYAIVKIIVWVKVNYSSTLSAFGNKVLL